MRKYVTGGYTRTSQNDIAHNTGDSSPPFSMFEVLRLNSLHFKANGARTLSGLGHDNNGERTNPQPCHNCRRFVTDNSPISPCSRCGCIRCSISLALFWALAGCGQGQENRRRCGKKGLVIRDAFWGLSFCGRKGRMDPSRVRNCIDPTDETMCIRV